MALIFFGTLDQSQFGIRHVQMLYFKGFATIWKYPDSWWFGDALSWLGLPIPGGLLLGPLLVLNLVAAHFRYFQFSLGKLGLILIHIGILLLLIGQGIADFFQKDHYMWLDKGQSSNFAQSFHENELVIIDRSAENHDSIVSIPAEQLQKHQFFQHDAMPFKLRVIAYYANSVIRKSDPSHQQNPLLPKATQGVGNKMNLTPEPAPLTREDDERNLPSLLLAIDGADGTLGTWLLNTAFEGRIPSQTFEYKGRSYEIALRIRRKYFPFTVTLEDFEHRVYPGSEIPKAFTSWVRVTDHVTGEERESKIYMNHPLRYKGYTFYQASFGKQGNASMFQIVKNPGWLIPYFSLTLVTVGLIFQFSTQLFRFLGGRFTT